jgi:hypothetical protein
LAITKRAIEYVQKGFLVSYVKHGRLKGSYNITVSVTGKLKNYFGMDTLALDYEQCGLNGDNIRNYKEANFGDFHYGKYDMQLIEITGLILGYPIRLR